MKRQTARSAARRGRALDGADAQALEGALALTERERDDAIRLLAKVVRGGNPTGPEWQRINELIRSVDR